MLLFCSLSFCTKKQQPMATEEREMATIARNVERVGTLAIDILTDNMDAGMDQPKPGQEDIDKNKHYFEEKDTFLYSILSHDKADKMTKWVWNRYTIGFVSVITTLWYFPSVFVRLSEFSNTFWIIEIVWFSLVFIYFIIILLTVNKKAFWIIIRSFDLWIKLYACFKIIVASIIYYPSVESQLYSKKSYSIFLFYRVDTTLIIILFSFIDGFHASYRNFLVFGFILSGLFSMDSIRWTFDNRPEYNIYVDDNHSLSLVSQISSATRILSIFLWKQTIKLAWNRDKSAIVIKGSAKIKWDTDN